MSRDANVMNHDLSVACFYELTREKLTWNHVYSNVPGEATKKRLVFERLMSPSSIFYQASAMAATGE